MKLKLQPKRRHRHLQPLEIDFSRGEPREYPKLGVVIGYNTLGDSRGAGIGFVAFTPSHYTREPVR